jgi:hypothetical protein
MRTSNIQGVVLEKRGLPCGSSTCSTSTRVDNIIIIQHPGEGKRERGKERKSERAKEGKRERGWCSRKEDFHFFHFHFHVSLEFGKIQTGY